jgi:hypothetical protein
MNFRNISMVRKLTDKSLMFESSLSRIWQHAQAANNKSFAILTSWRQSKNRKDNIKSFSDLKAAIRNLDYGFVEVKGHWKECQDSNILYDECPEDQLVDAIEPSLFIPEISKKEALKLADHFEQDAIVFGGPEVGGKIVLLFRDGKIMPIGDFKAQTLGQAFTELRKSKESNKRFFKFEGVEYPPQSFIETIIENLVEEYTTK